MTGDGGDNEFVVLIEGEDTVDGAGGDDLIDGGDGADDLDGGGGTTSSAISTRAPGSRSTSERGRRRRVTRWPASRTSSGPSFDDAITGDGGPNTIEGADGADELFGLAGDDMLFGGWADGFDDGSVDAVDGGADTDECDAETETNCEADPPAPTTSSGAGRFGAWDGGVRSGGPAPLGRHAQVRSVEGGSVMLPSSASAKPSLCATSHGWPSGSTNTPA